MKKIYYDVLEFDQWRFLVAASQDGLVYVDVATATLDNLLRYLRKTEEKIEIIKDRQKTKDYTAQLREYLMGRRRTFELPLDFSGYGTDFQQAVWRELLKIPYGQESSYSQLAIAIGRPTATRAVGSAVGKNPLSLVIPCHRVLRKDGGIGGYAGGLPLKYRLLALENIPVK